VTGVQFPAGAVMGIFHFGTMYKPALGPIQPPIQWVSGVLIPGAKWPGYESGCSPPFNANIKNTWSYTSTPPVCLQSVVLN